MSSHVDQIKQKLAIEDVVGSYIKLERAGQNFKGRCPFHNEKTPSFFVSPDRGSYYCFGCNAKGDIFSFVEQFEGLDFMGSLKMLAQRAGVTLEFDRNSQGQATEKERLFSIMEEATVFFEQTLSRSPEAQKYILSRGITKETAEKFRLGFALPEWRLLYTHLKGKKYTDQDIEKAGLAKKPEEAGKGYYDRFRGRVMFPISDSSGRVIAFSGRILVDDGKSAKYLNSPDTPLFNKSTVLYGIDKAKQDIRIKNYSILVEGQMDLVLSHQAGIRNTVAVSGTALADSLVSKENTINNLGIVKRLSNNIILAFDSDGAGRKAAMRSAQIALGLGMDVKIASMPEGKDPADLILENPELWKGVLRNSKPVVEFQLDTVLSQTVDSRKIPKALRDNVLPFIAPLTGAMEKAHYIKLIKEKTGLSEESIKEDLRALEQSLPDSHASRESVVEPKSATTTRLDAISRKLFSLLFFIEKHAITGTLLKPWSSLQERLSDTTTRLRSQMEPYRDELIFEAEVVYGTAEHKLKELSEDFQELIFNFEEDILRKEFSHAMEELAKKERSKDVAQADELIKKCQDISLRLRELLQKKSSNH